MPEIIEAQVVYALAAHQRIYAVKLAPGATVREAIEASGVLAQYQELNAQPWTVGVFGVRVTLDSIVGPGDRVEIYRALVADPKDTRRRRAAQRARKR